MGTLGAKRQLKMMSDRRENDLKWSGKSSEKIDFLVLLDRQHDHATRFLTKAPAVTLLDELRFQPD